MLRLKKKEGGFTLIELLIVVVIIGILAAVAVPMYSRYITTAKAAEASTNLTALVQYVQSYARAHPDNWTSSGLMDTSATEGGWVGEVVGDPVYFSYTFTAGAAPYVEADGGRTGETTFATGTDFLRATFDAQGDVSTWTAGGKMEDVKPD